MTGDFDISLVGAAPIPAPGPSPIVDVSYRGYDGPLRSHGARWWVVALATMRLARRKPLVWVLAALALWPYAWAGVSLYLRTRLGAAGAFNPLTAQLSTDKFAVVFFRAIDNQGFLLFILCLVLGSAAIAADIRTNALQVYLSRPITRIDYLIGKWAGIFLPLYAVAVIPALLVYAGGLLAFWSDGFWQEDRLLILRLLIACAIPAIVHASLMLGFSAWSRSPTMAGALYAGLYFASVIITGIIWAVVYHGNIQRGLLVRNLSLAGVISSLAQHAYHVVVHADTINRRTSKLVSFNQHAPSLAIMAAIAAALVLLGIAAAYSRIRAVEVVRG
jgi:ABC-2 type transport system permease protein